MLERLKGFNKDSMMPEIGIGICRVPLIKGYIGSREKLQHTIIGDTVNKVARLESLCKELHVSLIITTQVWEDLDEDFRSKFHIFKNVSVKGISEKFDVYGLRTSTGEIRTTLDIQELYPPLRNIHEFFVGVG
jgi:class 3 adenylate cyclase